MDGLYMTENDTERISREKVKKVIGVTGGVGAGKSTVLHILKEEFHAHVIMADEIGRALMEPGQVCFGQIHGGYDAGASPA